MSWNNKIVGHEDVPPEQLLAHPDNWRIHPRFQQEALRGVINDIGFIKSVTVNKMTGRVVDGHLRVTLALRDNVPTIPVEYVDLTEEEEAEALLIIDPIAALAGSDKGNLENLLQMVNTDDENVIKLLSDTADNAGLDWGKPEQADAEPQIDRAAELLEKWKVETGDLWQIGEHRLLCGDSTKREDVERVMGGEEASLVITSPPYFNQREYSQWEEYEDYLLFVSKIVDALPMADDCVLGVNIGSDEPARRWMPSDWWGIMRDADYLYRECIAWVKAAAVWSVPRSMHINKGHYFPAQRWEVILVGSKGKHPKFEINDVAKVREFDENVWNIGVVTGGEQKTLGHNAPFPVEIPERFIMAYTTKDKLIFEPFIGSGTTIVACQNLGRRGRGIEISPAYCAVTLERMATAFPSLVIQKLP